MLKSIFVSNYALIDQVEIDFTEGFSVITGETGAGKSIILGALSLVLGQRSDVSVLKNKEKKSVIEAEFNITNYGFEKLFELEDVDFSNDTTIRREILTSGKSRAFINDTPVNLSFLKSISQQLIDIHSQHQNLLLGESHFQLNVVDTVAGNQKVLAKYKNNYLKYKTLLKEKSELESQNQQLKNDVDYMQFQFTQLSELKLLPNEQGDLESERELLSHAEEIKANLFSVVQSLGEEPGPVLGTLKDVNKHIEKVASFLTEGESWSTRANSAYLELEDLLQEIELKMDGIDHDPTQLEYVNSRLDQIYSLQQKHRVDDINGLIKIQNDLEEKLQKVSSFDEYLTQISLQIETALVELNSVSDQLTESRIKVKAKIEKVIMAQLMDLGMPNARLVVDCSSGNDFTESGKDDINFLFSANKTGELSAIPKVASGGEMSRVMLCIKSLLSHSKGLPTIIFDEIDTGVSGLVADKMGSIMQNISKNIQVISITHLPQIAVKGAQHYKVYKTDSSTDTQTSIEKLTEELRVTEIAKMLSGSNLTEAALSNARELLKESV